MTERTSTDPHPGLVDRIAKWLLPSLYPEPPGGRPGFGRCEGGCIGHDHAGKRELEAGS